MNTTSSSRQRNRGGSELAVILVIVVSLIVIVLLAALAMPIYRVWQREKSGQAELAEATWSRKIRIEEASAVMESAKHLADAEIERARGVAEANRIIGESLQDNEAYLRYLWVQGMHDGGNQIIYVPTEAQLPLLEATRLPRAQ